MGCRTAIDAPVLSAWLTEANGGLAVYQDGARHDDPAAFESYLRPNVDPGQLPRAFAGKVPVEVTKVVILTGIVRMLVVSRSEIRNSVQEKMKQSTAVAARPGAASGRVILRKPPQMLQPSIQAAPSSRYRPPPS